jgi:hypothetical protein
LGSGREVLENYVTDDQYVTENQFVSENKYTGTRSSGFSSGGNYDSHLNGESFHFRGGKGSKEAEVRGNVESVGRSEVGEGGKKVRVIAEPTVVNAIASDRGNGNNGGINLEDDDFYTISQEGTPMKATPTKTFDGPSDPDLRGSSNKKLQNISYLSDQNQNPSTHFQEQPVPTLFAVNPTNTKSLSSAGVGSTNEKHYQYSSGYGSIEEPSSVLMDVNNPLLVMAGEDATRNSKFNRNHLGSTERLLYGSGGGEPGIYGTYETLGTHSKEDYTTFKANHIENIDMDIRDYLKISEKEVNYRSSNGRDSLGGSKDHSNFMETLYGWRDSTAPNQHPSSNQDTPTPSSNPHIQRLITHQLPLPLPHPSPLHSNSSILLSSRTPQNPPPPTPLPSQYHTDSTIYHPTNYHLKSVSENPYEENTQSIPYNTESAFSKQYNSINNFLVPNGSENFTSQKSHIAYEMRKSKDENGFVGNGSVGGLGVVGVGGVGVGLGSVDEIVGEEAGNSSGMGGSSGRVGVGVGSGEGRDVGVGKKYGSVEREVRIKGERGRGGGDGDGDEVGHLSLVEKMKKLV